MTKNLIHRYIAFFLVISLAFVQLVLVNHRSHHSYKSSSDQEQVHAFKAKCDICEYMFTKRYEPAILSTALILEVFECVNPIPVDKKTILLPFTTIDNCSNKGPPALS